MYDAQEAMRLLWGDQYPAKIEQYQGFIKAGMAKWSLDELHATMEIIKRLQACDLGGEALVFAACVELLEPIGVEDRYLIEQRE